MESIMRSRLSGERDGTYAMLMQLVAAKQTPECLRALENMVVNPIGCWRDVRGFIRHYEQHGDPGDAESAMAIMEGCVRMTNAQLRKDRAAGRPSWAAKWVPREPKCRASPLLRWYYDALAADMFPGAPDANRRFRKLVSALSPSAETSNSNSTIPGLVHMVRQAERARTSEQTDAVNALWQKHLARRCKPKPNQAIVVPALSLAHSMGPGHSNCLHAGIGLALHFMHLSPWPSHLLTFSSHAQWHDLTACPDFVSQVQQLLCSARSPNNGLNANAMATNAMATNAMATNAMATNAMATNAMVPAGVLLIISDMEHDDPSNNPSPNPGVMTMTWNASRNGRPASFHGDKPHILQPAHLSP
jgi:hypothetical protein